MATTNNVSANQVSDLYQDVFGRLPDSNGLNFWQNSGLAAPQIKQEFFQSPEYSAGVSNLYRSVLGRQPDAAGQMYWQTSGVGLPDMTQHFQDSPEYVNDGSYQSNLIASLRAANSDPMTNNPGVDLLDNPENSKLTLNFNKPVPTGLSNRPEKLKIKPVDPTPLVPDTPVGGGGGGGGSGGGGSGGGGGPIIIGPSDPVVDDNTGTDDGSDDSWSEWDDYTDTGDDSVTDDDSWSEWDDYTDTGNDSIGDDSVVGDDDKDTDGLDDLINDLIGNNQDAAGGGDDSAGNNDIVDIFDPVDDINTDDADADAIAKLYYDILGRDPDEAGLEWWDQTGLGVDEIADLFRGSDEYASLNADPDIPDYSNDLYGDDVDTSIGIDLGQADDLGGIFEMYDPLDNSSPIVFDMKGDDYGTNFGSDWLINAIFGDMLGGGGGGGGGKPFDDQAIVVWQ